jgi:hypothetical protein
MASDDLEFPSERDDGKPPRPQSTPPEAPKNDELMEFPSERPKRAAAVDAPPAVEADPVGVVVEPAPAPPPARSIAYRSWRWLLIAGTCAVVAVSAIGYSVASSGTSPPGSVGVAASQDQISSSASTPPVAAQVPEPSTPMSPPPPISTPTAAASDVRPPDANRAAEGADAIRSSNQPGGGASTSSDSRTDSKRARESGAATPPRPAAPRSATPGGRIAPPISKPPTGASTGAQPSPPALPPPAGERRDPFVSPRPDPATSSVGTAGSPVVLPSVPPPLTAPAPASPPKTAAADPPAAAKPSDVSPAAADREAVNRILAEFRRLYSELDASAVVRIWPTVDDRALGRAFEQLEKQSIEFTNCRITLNGARAVASCSGTALYIPRAGNKRPRVDSRAWTFALNKANGWWWIESVKSK